MFLRLVVLVSFHFLRLELEMIPKGHSLEEVAKLLSSSRLQNILTQMEKFADKPRKAQELVGNRIHVIRHLLIEN